MNRATPSRRVLSQALEEEGAETSALSGVRHREGYFGQRWVAQWYEVPIGYETVAADEAAEQSG